MGQSTRAGCTIYLPWYGLHYSHASNYSTIHSMHFQKRRSSQDSAITMARPVWHPPQWHPPLHTASQFRSWVARAADGLWTQDKTSERVKGSVTRSMPISVPVVASANISHIIYNDADDRSVDVIPNNIALLVGRWGRWPSWMPLALRTYASNSFIDFHLLSDAPSPVPQAGQRNAGIENLLHLFYRYRRDAEG